MATLCTIAAATGAAACGQAPIQANESTLALSASAMKAEPWAPTQQEPVTLEIDMPKTVKTGTLVPIRVTLHNGTPRPIAIGFGANAGFDVVVAQVGVRADSGAVWSPLKMPTTSADITLTDPIQPGRDTTFEVKWPGTDDAGHNVPPGRYRVRAMVAAALLHTQQIWTRWTPVVVQ